MGPEDLLRMQIPIEKLTSRNFESWYIRIEALLAGKQISEVLTNEYPEPQAAGYGSFQKNDKTGMAIIIQTVSDEYLRLIKNKTCKQAIQILKDRLERTGALGRLYARREFQSLKYEMRDNLSTFLIKFDSCVERMEVGGLNISEEEKITQLLMAMPGEFSSVITAIETMAARDSSISAEFVKSRLLDEEIKLKKGHASNHGRDVAFLTCFNCGKAGHIKRNCRYKQRTEHNKKRDNREPSEYDERRVTERKSSGSMRDGQQRQRNKSNYPRRTDRDNSNGRARTAEATHDEEDVITFCSEAHAAHGSVSDENTHFILDSEASHHMINEELFDLTHNRRKLREPTKVTVAKADQTITVSEIADINLSYKGKSIQLTDVLCAKQLKCNLLSIKRLEAKGFRVEFKNGSGYIYRENELIIQTQPGGKLYNIPFKRTLKLTNAWARLALTGNSTTWHKRLGHSHTIKPDGICRVCIEAKMNKQPHTKTRPKAKHILDKIHVDLCGPISPIDIDGEKFLTIVDDYSHFTAVYPIRNKSETSERLEEFKHKYENKFGRRIKAIRCDSGTEFVNETVRKIFKDTEFEITPPYTHALNGVAERANRTITEMARAMIIDKNVEKYLWPYAVMYAAYILNRIPSKAICDELPATRAKIETDYSKIKIFECELYSLVEKPFRDRFDSKTKKMKLVGITNTGYKAFDPVNRRVYTRSDVKFIESDEERTHKVGIEFEPDEEDEKRTDDHDDNQIKNTGEKEEEQEDKPEEM